MDVEAFENGATGSRLHRTGNTNGDDEVRHFRLRHICAGNAHVQRLQRRTIARSGRIQYDQLRQTARKGSLLYMHIAHCFYVAYSQIFANGYAAMSRGPETLNKLFMTPSLES